jgi:predicted GNAT superfamily acetyltransferase
MRDFLRAIEKITIYQTCVFFNEGESCNGIDRFVRMGLEVMKNPDIIRNLGGRRFLFAVESSHDKNDYQKYEDLRQEIWKEPSDRMAGVRNLLSENYFDRGSSLFTGVFVEDKNGEFPKNGDHLVGFSYGFVGVRDKELGFRSLGNFLFYSQYLGVKKDFQNLGLGVLIKQFQKKVVLEVFGVDTITCTYDPLVGVNAYRNIHCFGMDVVQYRESYYRDLGGELNRADIPCDRFFVSWDLKKDTRRPSYDLDDLVGKDLFVIRSKTSEIQGTGGPVNLEIVADIRTDWRQDYALAEIPFDFYRMLELTDVADGNVRKIPLDWRLATREVFQNLLARKYEVIDFRIYQDRDRKRNFYVLKN